MRAYGVQGPNASGSANKTLITIIGGTTVRPRIFDLNVGSSGTPADYAAQFKVGRFTAVGTAGSNPTPEPVDPADVACLATAGITHSVEPTYTAGKSPLGFSMNLRANFRWVAMPGFELVGPATANNGLGLQLVSAVAASIFDGSIFFAE